MTNERQIGDTVVLRQSGSITGATADGGETRAYRVRLDVGGEISLTREQLAAATDADEARELLLTHFRTGEPLSEDEVTAICEAGLANGDDFDGVGGGLFQHCCRREEE